MHRFEIWAPLPNKVAVRVNDTENAIVRPMNGPDDQGWWHLDVEEAGPGSDYCFLIDDDSTCYPDPRSQWQPPGVHGMSRVYDQSTFQWTDAFFRPAPLASAIVYELHIGTFTPEGT